MTPIIQALIEAEELANKYAKRRITQEVYFGKLHQLNRRSSSIDTKVFTDLNNEDQQLLDRFEQFRDVG